MELNSPKIYCVYLNQDDPKKNTAIKLKKHNLIKIKRKIYQCPRKAIILDPFAEKEISIDDRDLIKRNGLIVIDCSWEKIETIFSKKFRTGRSLPHLLASNTINYGRWDKLSSAEAIAAALNLTGFKKKARELLSIFSWGKDFWKINKNQFSKKKNL